MEWARLAEPLNTASHAQHTEHIGTDREFSGEINRASNQGANFALLLAMLEQDYLHRPKLVEAAPNEKNQALSIRSHYPVMPLKVEANQWDEAIVAKRLLQEPAIKSAHLWLLMHPQGLSLYNDSSRIDDEVRDNCDIHAQQRLKGAQTQHFDVDETRLYDVLQGMAEPVQTVA